MADERRGSAELVDAPHDGRLLPHVGGKGKCADRQRDVAMGRVRGTEGERRRSQYCGDAWGVSYSLARRVRKLGGPALCLVMRFSDVQAIHMGGRF